MMQVQILGADFMWCKKLDNSQHTDKWTNNKQKFKV